MSSAAIECEPDRDLAIQVRAGDAAALARLYLRTADELLRLGTRLLGSRSDGQDLVHDIFVALPELLANYEDRDRLDAWLRGIAIRAALGRLRREKRRHGLILGMPHGAVAPPKDSWTAIDLERAIAALDAGERSVFVLRHFHDLPHEEVASLLGISAGAARVRYFRAVDRLRSALEPYR